MTPCMKVWRAITTIGMKKGPVHSQQELGSIARTERIQNRQDYKGTTELRIFYRTTRKSCKLHFSVKAKNVEKQLIF